MDEDTLNRKYMAVWRSLTDGGQYAATSLVARVRNGMLPFNNRIVSSRSEDAAAIRAIPNKLDLSAEHVAGLLDLADAIERSTQP
jgi:hypothetical protein